MSMNFEELGARTREYMLREFEQEQSGVAPYRGRGLTPDGEAAFQVAMRGAIIRGTEQTLFVEIAKRPYWLATETYIRNGVTRERAVNLAQAAERLCLTEFNTWYVRGFAARLLDEKVERCQAYRAMIPKWEPGECAAHEGQIYSVRDVYDGHRRRYWPEPGDKSALSIPFGPGCHHTIRRIKVNV